MRKAHKSKFKTQNSKLRQYVATTQNSKIKIQNSNYGKS